MLTIPAGFPAGMESGVISYVAMERVEV